MFGTEDHQHAHDLKFREFHSAEPDLRLDEKDRQDIDPNAKAPDLDDVENSALHRRLLAYYASELSAQHSARLRMQDDERMFDGDQWTEEDKAMLIARGQQPLVYNVIAPAVNWMLGTEARNRTQFKVLPRRKDGSKSAERKTQLMKYLDDANRAPYDTSRAYRDAVIVGLGWLEEGYQGEGGEEPVYSRYETWRNIVWDSRATEMDLSDARYIFRAKWVDCDIATKLFPERAHLIEAAANNTLDVGGLYLDGYADEAMDELELFHDAHDSSGTTGLNGGHGRRRVRMIEGWFVAPAMSKVMRGGQFSGEVFDPLSPGHQTEVMTRRATVKQQVKMRVHYAILTTAGIIDTDVSPYRHNRYPFTPIWGNRNGADGMPYGLVHGMADIQRDLNKRASKALHILSTSKVIMDKGAVDDMDAFADEVARPDGIIEKKKGAHLEIDAGRELAAPHMDLMSRDIEMIQQQSGITDEAMGKTTNASSGKAIIARQTQGSVATNHFLDNLRFALSIHGEKKLSLIEQYFDEEKEFRITNSRGVPDYVKINDGSPENDIVATKADFIIAEDDWKATIRQAQTEALMEVVQQLAPAQPQIVMLLLDLLVESMDLPYRDELVSRIRQLTGMEDPDADPEAADPETIARRQKKAEEAQLEERAKRAELATKEAEAAEKGAKAEKTGYEARRIQTQHSIDSIDAAQKAITAAVEFLQARAAAPLADRILADARAEAQAPQSGPEAGQMPPDQLAPPQAGPMPPAQPEPQQPAPAATPAPQQPAF